MSQFAVIYRFCSVTHPTVEVVKRGNQYIPSPGTIVLYSGCNYVVGPVIYMFADDTVIVVLDKR